MLGIHTGTLRSWVKSVDKDSLEGLEYKPGRGRKRQLLDIHYKAIQEWIKDDPNLTAKKIIQKLEEAFRVKSSYSVVYRGLHEHKLSYITPRPWHHKQDKSTHEDFKKNLSEVAKDCLAGLYFFYEARHGTHSKLGHGWLKKGVRTQVKVKLGFENFYVYSAVSPISGEDFTLTAPKVNTDFMNVFLAEMSKHLGEKHAIIVMDCAGWHRSRTLIVPNNIQIMYLPPYSLELNPVERLWQHTKSNIIKNRIYKAIADLEDTVWAFICNFKKDVIKAICSASYLLA